MAGWILKGKYETGSFKNYQKASQQNHKQQPLNTPQNNTLVSSQHLKKPASSSEKPILSKPKEIFTENSKKLSSKKLPDITDLERQTLVDPLRRPFKKTNSAVVLSKSSPYNSPKQAVRETKLKEKYHSLNQQEFLKIKDRQSFFKSEGKYSFLINVFSTEKQTFEYIKNLKNRFPLWSFFIRSDRNHLRVYLGPFQTKKQALEFIKNIPSPSPFPNYFLEEESI